MKDGNIIVTFLCTILQNITWSELYHKYFLRYTPAMLPFTFAQCTLLPFVSMNWHKEEGLRPKCPQIDAFLKFGNIES